MAPAAGFCGSCGRPIAVHSLLGDFIDEVSGSLREIVLVDKMTGSEILRSPVFRFVFLVAMGPLAIALLPSNGAILNGLAIYSALLWALLLYRLFADRHLPFRWALGMMLVTCFLMVPILEFYLWLPPRISDRLVASDSLPPRLLGYVFGVGVREELCKAAPLLALALVSARMRRPLNGLVLGMMSGVGFAAAENVYYVYRTVSQAASVTAETGEAGNLVMPVYNNVVRMAMGPFVHGCLSGIFGYFIGLAAMDRERRAVFLLAGLGLASVLHGLYDTGVTTSPLLGLSVQALTYFLLMTYVLKARGLASAREIGGGVFNRTVMIQLAPGSFPAAAGESTLPPPPQRPLPRAPFAWRLRGVAGPPAGLTFNLSGEIRMGRDGTRCALLVDEPAVSREHAVLIPDGQRRVWRIRRVSTKAPLYLNGQEVQEARLAAGDQIQVGTWVLVLEVA
jgi:RsiW-degrading membrane proteinase PrsW (M82 family)